MKVILRKLILDFRRSLGKLTLLLLAASLSAWGISGVMYSYFMTERDFEVNFGRTNPADMALIIDNYTPQLEEKLLADQNVIDIERREMISARIKSSRNSWMPVIIWAIDDPNNMRYDLINILDDHNKVSGNFLIEKNAFIFLREDQDSVELIFQSNEDIVTWKMAGKVHDARQAPARMEGLVYAYATSIETIEPYLTNGRRRLLVKTNVSSDKEKLQSLSKRLEEVCEANGGKLIGVNIPTPGKHIHQGIVDGIAFLQESGGSILSVMGIILLSLILLTWIFPQLTDIGVMKAIGASTRYLFISYVIVLSCIVSIGILIGLPLGYKTASLYNGAVAFFQNFEVVPKILPLPIHLLVILTCMVIPLLIGIFPLYKSSKTTVNEALNKIFYIPHRRIFRLSQQLISNTRLKYGLNNLFRQSQRTALTMLLLAVGMALYFSASNVDYSIRADLKEFEETSPYEVIVIMPEKMKPEDVSFLDELKFVDQIHPLNSSRMNYVPPKQGNPELTGLRILSPGVEIDDSFVLRGKIDKSCVDCIYVSGEDMRKKFEDVDLGTPIEMTSTSGENRMYRFSGVVKDLVVIGAPFLAYDKETENSFNGLAFKLKPDISREEFLKASNAIDDLFIDNEINVLALWSVSLRMAGIIGHLEPTFLIIKITGIFTIVLGLFGLIIVLNLTIQERTREIGIMKSLGSPFRKVSGMFRREFFLISLIAIVVGGLLAIPVATALIGVISETIIRHPVAFKNDFFTILVASFLVILVQTLIITVYNRFKIGKNARELLDHHF